MTRRFFSHAPITPIQLFTHLLEKVNECARTFLEKLGIIQDIGGVKVPDVCSRIGEFGHFLLGCSEDTLTKGAPRIYRKGSVCF